MKLIWTRSCPPLSLSLSLCASPALPRLPCGQIRLMWRCLPSLPPCYCRLFAVQIKLSAKCCCHCRRHCRLEASSAHHNGPTADICSPRPLHPRPAAASSLFWRLHLQQQLLLYPTAATVAAAALLNSKSIDRKLQLTAAAAAFIDLAKPLCLFLSYSLSLFFSACSLCLHSNARRSWRLQPPGQHVANARVMPKGKESQWEKLSLWEREGEG